MVCTVLVVVGLASGCGSGRQPSLTSSGPAVSPSGSTPDTSSPSTQPSEKPDRPSGKPDEDDIVELRGSVEAGVEPGCLILRSGGETYGLYGGDPKVLKVGAKVVVQGVAQPDMITTCQQGIPFQVTEVHEL